MISLAQVITLSRTAIASISQRAGASLVTFIGVFTMTAVLTALLSMGEGARAWAEREARPDRAIILSRGAPAAPMSTLSRDSIASIANIAGVKRDARGSPLASASSMAMVDVARKDNQRGIVFLLGITPEAREVYPEIRIIEGRPYRAGLFELIVSESARKLNHGFQIGDRIGLRAIEWTVVGVFADTGGVFDTVMFTDGETLLSAFGRSAFQQATVLLNSPNAFSAFKDAVMRDGSLSVDVYTDADSRTAPLKGIRDLLDYLSYFVGLLMAAGAICATLSSLYIAVDARQREIATLRAMGFGSFPVVLSVIVESLTLALPAAALGSVVAWLLFNANNISTSGLTFPLAVNMHSAGVAISWAIVVALLGALLPAIRAARLPIATALRGV